MPAVRPGQRGSSRSNNREVDARVATLVRKAARRQNAQHEPRASSGPRRSSSYRKRTRIATTRNTDEKDDARHGVTGYELPR